jgi:hypothetical protein
MPLLQSHLRVTDFTGNDMISWPGAGDDPGLEDLTQFFLHLVKGVSLMAAEAA